MTDPSFAGQLITFTYPHIGNYGVSARGDGVRPRRGRARRSCATRATARTRRAPSAAGWTGSTDCGVQAISGVDTRALVRHIRDAGAMRGGVFPGSIAPARARELIAAEPPMAGQDLARVVTPEAVSSHGRGDGPADRRDRHGHQGLDGPRARRTRGPRRAAPLHELGAGAARIRPRRRLPRQRPGRPRRALLRRRDGPGDRRAASRCGGSASATSCSAARSASRRSSCPSATAAPTIPSATSPPAASRSPRRTTASPRSAPTAGRTIDSDEPVRWETDFGAAALSHVNLYDRTVEGLELLDVPGGTVQYHPEAGPGPHDSLYLFDRFLHAHRRAPPGCPAATDIQKILILGSGPIVIGQAAEFDYSGVQACKVLREEGYEVVLVNSNPATIMTDPEFADATYVEPLLPGPVRKVIERERPDALLGTLGGQTALNLSKALHDDGTLDAPRRRADRRQPRRDRLRGGPRDCSATTMEEAGLRMPRSAIATSIEQARAALPELGLPCIVRPAFTLGGRGGGIARTEEDFERIAALGLEASPIGQVLLDESVIGWGEFELEVMRDRADNVVIVCSIENVDPMGVHTGDSVTVAPQQTLTDRLYQQLRDQAITVIRAVGVETGGSNVQFAVNPETRGDPRHRDEPARLALLGARLQGHRLPDRQDRRAAGRRLHAR